MHVMNGKDEDDKKENETGNATQLMQQNCWIPALLSSPVKLTRGALTEKVVTQLLLLQGISDAPIKIYLNSRWPCRSG